MATNTSDFFTFSKTAGTAKNLQKPTDGGDNNLWGGYINVDLDTIVGAVNATSDLIADANQNELVDFTATGSAVNHIGITNAATGNPPQITAAGDDTNIDLTLTAKGTGDINLTPGTNGDVNIPASKGITFGDDGEKIEGDGTKLDIAAAELDFSIEAGGDINIGADIGLTFGDDGEKIEGDGTDLTIASSATLNVNTGSASGNDLKVNTSQLVVEGDTGNVGIGTNSPGEELEVYKSASPTIRLNQNGDYKGLITLAGNDLEIRGSSGNIEFYTGNADGASSSERMRIDSSGNVLFGTENVVASGYAYNFKKFNNVMAIQRSGGTEGVAVSFVNESGISSGSIYNRTSSTSYNTSSDYRLKENVSPLTGAIDRLNQLKPSRFNFIADPDTTLDGFLAHEVSDHVPEAVSGEKDAVDKDGNPQYQGIDQAKLVPLLTAALQEAVSKIEALTARIEVLENA